MKRLTLDEMDRAAMILRASFDERLPWLAGLHTPEEDRAYFRHQVFAACEIWGAADPDIIGIIAFRAGWIDQLYVLPHYQGQGAGSALLGIAKAGSARLQLWTFQRNILARRFYEARDFIAVEQTDGHANEEREPDVRYRWDKASEPRLSRG